MRDDRSERRDYVVPAAKATILVCDTTLAKRHVVRSALERSPATIEWHGNPADAGGLTSSQQRTIALVEVVEPLTSEDSTLQVVRTLRQRGFAIVCYGYGCAAWSIATRCQVLLAGAGYLLDATQDDFASALYARVARLLDEDARRLDEQQRLLRIMSAVGLVGESESLLRVFRLVLRVSPLSDLPTLITGETGTGKELVARAIHQLDPKRGAHPIIAVNCAAVSAGLAESELFGHRRGAFTGADRDRLGLIRAANGGVLFLDEVGELDEGLQGKLLRVLQERRLFAVGDERETSVDFRVIAATNRNLEEMVQQRRFRADLLHRINVVSVHIPPLRDRRDDVRALVDYFVEKHRTLIEHLPRIGEDFVQAVSRLDLPGNARELENIVRRSLMAKEDATPLTLSDLPLSYVAQLAEHGVTLPSGNAAPLVTNVAEDVKTSSPLGAPFDAVGILEANEWSLARALDACEQLFVRAAFDRSHGNSSRTARLLGITARSVYNKVRKHGLIS